MYSFNIAQGSPTHLNNVEGLVNRGLLIEGKLGVNLCGNLARNNLQDLLAELDKEVIQCSIDLLVNGASFLLSVLNGLVDELCVLLLLGGCEDEGWVGSGVLRLVLSDSGKVTRVADDSL